MNVLLVAEEAAGVHALRCIVSNGHRVVAVLSSGWSIEPRAVNVKVAAERMGIPIWPLTLVKDPGFAARLRAEGVDLLIKVQSQCTIHPEVLRAPAVGSFSLHPGPWPAYAGPNAVCWSLYNGESSHATTLHWMLNTVDAGPVAYVSRFEIMESDTALTLSAKCVNLGLPLIEQLLRDAATSTIPRASDDMVARRHHGDAPPQNGYVNWIRHAVDIVNFVRACDYLPFRSPWGHPKTQVRDLEFMITKAKLTHLPCNEAPGTVGGADGRSVLVAAVDEWVLVRRLCLDGRHLDATDLLSPGDRLHEGGSPLALTTP